MTGEERTPPRGPEEPADLDDTTTVVPRGERGRRRDDAPVPGDAPVPVLDEAHDDATVVVPRRGRRGAGEGTAGSAPSASSRMPPVPPRAPVPPNGSVRSDPAPSGSSPSDPAPGEPADDATVIVRRGAAPEVDDATVVAPARRRSRTGAPAPERRRDPRPDPPASPVEDPPWSAVLPRSGVGGGVLPSIYGPRSPRQGADRTDADAVHRRIGPPPTAAAAAQPEREPLPSLARRARRSRIITVSAYAATAAASVLGLWGVARLAFG